MPDEINGPSLEEMGIKPTETQAQSHTELTGQDQAPEMSAEEITQAEAADQAHSAREITELRDGPLAIGEIQKQTEAKDWSEDISSRFFTGFDRRTIKTAVQLSLEAHNLKPEDLNKETADIIHRDLVALQSREARNFAYSTMDGSDTRRTIDKHLDTIDTNESVL